MRSPLAPRRGVVFTLSQFEGGRPYAFVGCSGCHFHEPVAVDDLEVDDTRVVRVALQLWGGHMCEDTYPSERPLDPADALPKAER